MLDSEKRKMDRMLNPLQNSKVLKSKYLFTFKDQRLEYKRQIYRQIYSKVKL